MNWDILALQNNQARQRALHDPVTGYMMNRETMRSITRGFPKYSDDSRLSRLLGLPVFIDPSVPDGEIWEVKPQRSHVQNDDILDALNEAVRRAREMGIHPYPPRPTYRGS